MGAVCVRVCLRIFSGIHLLFLDPHACGYKNCVVGTAHVNFPCSLAWGIWCSIVCCAALVWD